MQHWRISTIRTGFALRFMFLRFILKTNTRELHPVQILIAVKLRSSASQNWNWRIAEGLKITTYWDLQYNVLSIFIYFIHDHDKVNNHVKLLKVKPRYH